MPSMLAIVQIGTNWSLSIWDIRYKSFERFSLKRKTPVNPEILLWSTQITKYEEMKRFFAITERNKTPAPSSETLVDSQRRLVVLQLWSLVRGKKEKHSKRC